MAHLNLNEKVMLMTNLTRFIVLLAMFKLLTACATSVDGTKQSTPKFKGAITQQMSEILAAAESKELIFIDVPSAKNIISEKIMLAAIASGETTLAMEQLISLLQRNTSIQIGVVGKSQAINIMTIKQALKKLASKPVNGVVFVIGDAKAKEELSAANQHRNISVVVVNDNRN